ncbi:hypothetical protein LCGC14_0857270 [marine sediment metagenome]|uniref:Uncharacterized protein n=1 Tax=marine sediment metagenome TaxID=412755 RepID=A0A0F9RT40_9ZZZZ
MHQNAETKHRKLTKCSRTPKQHRSVDLRSTTGHILKIAKAREIMENSTCLPRHNSLFGILTLAGQCIQFEMTRRE